MKFIGFVCSGPRDEVYWFCLFRAKERSRPLSVEGIQRRRELQAQTVSKLIIPTLLYIIILLIFHREMLTQKATENSNNRKSYKKKCLIFIL